MGSTQGSTGDGRISTLVERSAWGGRTSMRGGTVNSRNQGRLITSSNFYEFGITGLQRAGLRNKVNESLHGCLRYCAAPPVREVYCALSAGSHSEKSC